MRGLMRSEEERRGTEEEECLAGLLRQSNPMTHDLRRENRLQRPQPCKHHTHGQGEKCDRLDIDCGNCSESCTFNGGRSLSLREQLRRRHMRCRVVEGKFVANAPREDSKCKHGDRDDHPLRTPPSCLLNMHNLIWQRQPATACHFIGLSNQDFSMVQFFKFRKTDSSSEELAPISRLLHQRQFSRIASLPSLPYTESSHRITGMGG